MIHLSKFACHFNVHGHMIGATYIVFKKKSNNHFHNELGIHLTCKFYEAN